MGTILVLGAPTIAVIIALVEVAKKQFNLPARPAAWLALVLCALASGGALLLQLYPESSPFLEAIGAAVVLFLAVTGTYEKAKDVGVVGKKPGPTLRVVK